MVVGKPLTGVLRMTEVERKVVVPTHRAKGCAMNGAPALGGGGKNGVRGLKGAGRLSGVGFFGVLRLRSG
jgi:hypothetical protein